MTATGRIPCVNPRCRRTASREKHPDWNIMICRKCWRTLPLSWTVRIRELEKRLRKLDRLIKRRSRAFGGEERADDLVTNHLLAKGGLAQHELDRCWKRIQAYYAKPERPDGLDAFLEEVGFAA